MANNETQFISRIHSREMGFGRMLWGFIGFLLHTNRFLMGWPLLTSRRHSGWLVFFLPISNNVFAFRHE